MKRLYTSVKLLAFTITLTFFFTACKQQEAETVIPTAVSFYNASPTVYTYDAYLNDAKVNTVALPFLGGVKYSQVAGGNYNVKFYIANGSSSVVSQNHSLAENTYSSIFLLGKQGSFETFKVTDEMNQTYVEGKSFVRFLNLSPDAPALDLVIKGGASIATNKTYKTFSNFVQVNSGALTFDIKQTSDQTVKTQATGTTLVQGRYYTVIVGGLVNPADQNDKAFTAQIILQQ